LHYDNAPPYASIVAREFFTKNNTTLLPTHPTFTVSPIDKTEVLEAEYLHRTLVEEMRTFHMLGE
jgi:hypothetical protein